MDTINLTTTATTTKQTTKVCPAEVCVQSSC